MTTVVLLSLTLPLAYAWQIERPYRTQIINGLVENNNTEDAASVGLGVNVNQYNEGPFNYENDDFIGMNVTMTANSRMDIEYEACWEDLR
ncbi:MAG: hypothetical protein OEY24_00020 [Candidatus Bathyarchaeota archaeon]|nr:hypothetical protein [Candidatus Bathyarchaeota archaeon]MDH5494078.1 hypothetical protein [Candidatus Bathyarchaeota archaeon]